MEQQQLEQDEESYEVPRLNVKSVIGFNGSVRDGLKVHPDRQHIIYPLGCAVVIEDISSSKTELLWGHTDYVTCISVSNVHGKYIASGQKTHMGFKSNIIVWDYQKREMKYKLVLHKVNIQALVFSPNDLYLASLGGCDDGSVVIWSIDTGEAICGSQAQVESAGVTNCISYSKSSDNIFVTGGESTLRVWELDVENRKIRPTDVDMGQAKRKVECIQMDDLDETKKFFYCGTTTGDIFAINMNSKRFQYMAPEKKKFENGVTALAYLKDGNFLVGTGCGKFYEMHFAIPGPDDGKKCKGKGAKNEPKSKIIRSWQDESVKCNNDAAITSIALRGAGHQFFVGTANARMYKFSYDPCHSSGVQEFRDCTLIKTCHSHRVNDVVFPTGTSDLIITCQKEQLRIWALKNMKELKRHIVPNMTCNALALACDGQAIVSAWDDGKIRVFGLDPKKNNDIVLRGEIGAAHNKGVTSVACTKNTAYGSREWRFNIVSGGGEGQVRVWSFNYDGRNAPSFTLIATLKEHKGLVSAIKIRKDDRECVSASTDGTCIIWDLDRMVRSQIVFANTLFKCVCYNNQENQIMTSGSDRKLAYWETYDGNRLRDVEGAKTGSVETMDISPDGEYLVTGGVDRLIKVWTYHAGEVIAVGMGHSAPISRVKICPNQRSITSVSEDGAILIWDFPC